MKNRLLWGASLLLAFSLASANSLRVSTEGVTYALTWGEATTTWSSSDLELKTGSEYALKDLWTGASLGSFAGQGLTLKMPARTVRLNEFKRKQ